MSQCRNSGEEFSSFLLSKYGTTLSSISALRALYIVHIFLVLPYHRGNKRKICTIYRMLVQTQNKSTSIWRERNTCWRHDWLWRYSANRRWLLSALWLGDTDQKKRYTPPLLADSYRRWSVTRFSYTLRHIVLMGLRNGKYSTLVKQFQRDQEVKALIESLASYICPKWLQYLKCFQSKFGIMIMWEIINRSNHIAIIISRSSWLLVCKWM